MPNAPRDAPRSLPPYAAPAGFIPDAWAGGSHVIIPGAGTGRVLVEEGPPRVVEVELPAPAMITFAIDRPTGLRYVLLVDPRVEPSRVAGAVAALELLEREGIDPSRVDIPPERDPVLHPSRLELPQQRQPEPSCCARAVS